LVPSGADWCTIERCRKIGKPQRELQERERERFFERADRLLRSTDSAEQKPLKEKLARLTFGS
jgi:hypothetical protein